MAKKGGCKIEIAILLERGKEKVMYIRNKYDQQDKIHILIDKETSLDDYESLNVII